MVTKEDTADNIIDQLNGFDLRDRVEILANVFINEGLAHLHEPIPENIALNDVISLVVKDKEKHGETIGNALTLQGLIMLEWLNT